MAAPTIKARLELVPGGAPVGGVTNGGFSTQEERNFRIEELKANKAISGTFPLLAKVLGPLGILASSPAALFGTAVGLGQTQIPGQQQKVQEILEDPFGTKKRKEQKAAEKNAEALEDLERSATSFGGGLQSLVDGSIRVVDQFGRTTGAFQDDSDLLSNSMGLISTVATGATVPSLNELSQELTKVVRRFSELGSVIDQTAGMIPRLGRARSASGNLDIIDRSSGSRNQGSVPLPFGGPIAASGNLDIIDRSSGSRNQGSVPLPFGGPIASIAASAIRGQGNNFGK